MVQHAWENWVGVLARHPLLVFLADMCLTVTVIILFFLLIRPFMKKLPRIGMYVLWIALLFRIVCPVSVRGVYHMLPRQVEQVAADINDGRKVENVAQRLQVKRRSEIGGERNHFRLYRETDGASAGSGGTDRTQAEKETEGKTRQTGQNQTEKDFPITEEQTARLLVFVWLSGVLACFGIMVGSLGRTAWKYKDARHCFDNVYTHPLIDSSFVGGILSPRIYVSEQLSEADRGYILCHERVHVRRRDYLLKPAAFCIFALYWFHPLVWAAYILMMKDMEVSCDEMAVKNFSEEEKRRYSYLLLSMAGGGRGLLHQNPAFSSGIVKERIVSVMRGKKMTGMVTVLVTAAVVFCSCGVASEPESTPVPKLPVEQQAGAVYAERAIPYDASPNIQIEGYSAAQGGVMAITPDGTPMMIVELYDKSDEIKYKYAKVLYEGSAWSVKEEAWVEKWNEDTAGKNYMVEDCQYGEDGKLYMMCTEESMPHTKFWSDWEKYLEDYYNVGVHLFRIDEKENTVTEIPIPKERAEEEDGEEGLSKMAGFVGCDFSVFADGNLLILSYQGKINGIYSGVTGEKLADIDPEAGLGNRWADPVAGDGFFAFTSVDQQSGKMEVRVVGEDGKYMNAIPVDFKADMEEGGMGPAICAKENEIMMASGEGIFEAEPEDSAFTSIVNAEKDNLYYLPSEGYFVMDFIGKGEQDDYLLYLCNDEADAGADSSKAFKICHYAKNDAAVIQ